MQILCVVSPKSLSFWGTCLPDPLPGLRPWIPLGDFHPPDPPVFFYVPPIIRWDRRPWDPSMIDCYTVLLPLRNIRHTFAPVLKIRWHHPRNWKYIAYHNADRVATMHRKLGEAWLYGFWDMQSDHRHMLMAILWVWTPTGGEVITTWSNTFIHHRLV